MTVLFFLLGLIIGSFLNVLIYRLPRNKSVIAPGSFCPICNEPIKFYDNVPVLSYLILRGRCRNCKNVIPIRYPIVELLTGFLFTGLALTRRSGLELIVLCSLISLLIAISFIDLEFKIVPDLLSLGGLGTGLFLSIFRRPNFFITDSLLGLLVGAGTLWAVSLAYELTKKTEGIGFGDVKLLGMIGSFIGPFGAIFSLFLGSLFGSIVGIAIILVKKKDLKYAIPFGPFLSLGAIIFIFWGEKMMNLFFTYIVPSWRI